MDTRTRKNIAALKWASDNPIRAKANRTLHNHRIMHKDAIIKITISEIENLFRESTHCPLCGIKYSNESRQTVQSLDRLNNERELRVDNVWVICNKCNATKQDRTMEEFYEYCQMVVNTWSMRVA